MVGHALTGGGGSSHVESVAPEAAPSAPMAYNQPQPCDYELRQFIDCSQQQHDLTLCDGFNSVLKECRAKYSKTVAIDAADSVVYWLL